MGITISIVLMIASIVIIGFKIGFPYYRALGFITFYMAIINAAHIYNLSTAKWIIYIMLIIELGILIKNREYIKLVKYSANDNKYWNNTKHSYVKSVEKDFNKLSEVFSHFENYKANICNRDDIFEFDYKDISTIQKEKIDSFWKEFNSHYNELLKLENKHRFFDKLKGKSNSLNAFKGLIINYSIKLLRISLFIELKTRIISNEVLRNVFEKNKAYKEIEKTLNIYNTHLDIVYKRLYISYKEKCIVSSIRRGKINISSKELSRLRDKIAYSKRSFLKIYFSLIRNPKVLGNRVLSMYEKLIYKVWYPVQRKIPYYMSYIRLTARENLIKYNEIKDIKRLLRPGDIMLTRRNWKLTNGGIPGFWIHSALYTGNIEDMNEYFGFNVESKINEVNKNVVKDIRDSKGQFKVIESIRPGVVFQTVEESASSDFLVVFRPKKLSKEDKFKAILRAFENYKKPYDYSFDFLSNEAFVCSELIVKAYEELEGKKGINFDKNMVSGRLVVMTNDIVKKFDIEYGTEDAELDFVMFYEGNEKEGRVNRRGIYELRKSWRKNKIEMIKEVIVDIKK
ncbi:MAG: YiiX/YebB-like N1pC/P60 family cysteine hydrolase [Clostridia bacterium]|jgi:hypothetical protein|nr:YiiX/YebB-like N1pC/P60 family cysteine hydrolase [Clostridia bacterium]